MKVLRKEDPARVSCELQPDYFGPGPILYRLPYSDCRQWTSTDQPSDRLGNLSNDVANQLAEFDEQPFKGSSGPSACPTSAST